MNRVSAFLQDKIVFVTGATGFLGQAIVEKILWSAPGVRRIYLLIRPKPQFGGGVWSATERLQREIFPSTVFERLREARRDDWQYFLQEKLFAVAGDAAQEHLGVDAQSYSRLCKETDLVINSAALVSFDAPLDEALAQNVFSARRVAEFSNQCGKAVLLHVSTAYVSGDIDGAVPETAYHLASGGENAEPFPNRKFTNVHADIEHMEQIIRRVEQEALSPELDRELKRALLQHFRKSPGGRNVRRREKIEKLRKKWIKNRLKEEGMQWARQRGWNDTYTYTKAIAEQLIVSFRRQAPTVILRPSIIESSLAEPNPGWLDGLRMADPLIAAIGKGRLRSLPLNPEITIDLVPVDLVVNALLASIPETSQEGGLKIYQVATGSQNPITLGQLYRLIHRYFTKNPLRDKAGNPIRVKRVRFPNPTQFRIQHRLKAVPLDTAEKTLEKWPGLATEKFKRKLSATRAAHQRLYYYGEIYQPYLNLDCRFEVHNTLRLFGSLSEEEKKLFNFDVTQLNWRHYIQNVHIPGIKKYLMKMEGEDFQESSEASPQDRAPASTIPELLSQTAARLPLKTALQIKRDGRWDRFTYQDVETKAGEIVDRFRRLAFQKGDRVILYSENQPEWGIAYLGAIGLGLIVVPLDSQTSRREVWSVVRFTEACAILASENCFKNFSEEILEENERSEAPVKLLNVNQFCAPFSVAEYPLSTLQKEDFGGDRRLPEATEIEPDDVISILFTTGTAVDPKGAMHTHRNFLSNLFGVNRYLPIYETDNMLSVLPLYHALEFTCSFLMAIYGGATITFVRSLKPRVILENMRETGTTCLLGVPTLYNLIREDIERRISRTSHSTLRSNLMATSKQLSRSVERAVGKNIGRRVFAKVHQEFGGKIRVFVSGGSGLGDQLYEDFKALGMPIYEGYGLTETAPVLTVNPFSLSRKGSAGKALPGVKLRISHPDKDGIGEIVARTPSLMLGYYKNPAATARATEDGWFHTGDLGWLDEDGYLYITGRIKDVIVTGAGKNVYPADLEMIYKEIPHIKELCVLGIKNQLTEDVHAVIIADRQALDNVEPVEVNKTIQQRIQELGRQVPSYQRLQFLHFWPGPLPRKESDEVDRKSIRRQLLEDLTARRTPTAAISTRSSGRKASREEEVLEGLSRLSRIPLQEITGDSNLYTDLGFDSLMAIQLLLFLENRFAVSIPDAQAARIQSVAEVLTALASLKQEQTSAKKFRKTEPLNLALPYLQRSPMSRWLLGLSFRGLRKLYKTYFRLELHNSGNLPQGVPYVLAANHSSHLDTGAIISAVGTTWGIREAQRLHVLGASDYFFDTPVKRWLFTTLLNVVPIEREETSLGGFRTVGNILSAGEAVLIFPEGTRSRTGQIQSFRPGLGLIACELRVPIVPAYIEGTFEALPAGKNLPAPGHLKVSFGSPIGIDPYLSSQTQLPRDELYRKITDDVRQAIEQLRNTADYAD